MAITQEEVRNLLSYKDGVLFWKVKNTRIKPGDKAGSITNAGYLSTRVNGNRYLNHRLIWLYHFGYFPEQYIDHIDRNPLNNKVENLREASPTCNTRNSGNFSTNKSGIKGVSWSTNDKL